MSEDIPRCSVCGKRAIYNVPRLGPAGGYLHEDGTFLCNAQVSCPHCSILHAPIDGNFYCPTCAGLRKDLGLENHIDEEGNLTRR